MKKLAPVLALLALALPGTGRAQVKIGFINSKTGGQAPIGETLTNGAEMAVADLKAKGINVQVFQQDDASKQPNAMSAFEQLSEGDEVSVIVGPYTSASSAAVAQQANAVKVPQIIPAAAKEDITRQGFEYVFRLNAPARQYAQSLLDAVTALGKPKSIAFIYEATDFGSSVSAVGKEYATKKGMQVVADEAYQAGAPDYRSTLTKIKSMNPDLIFLVSYVTDAVTLMRQAKELGLKPQAFLGGGAGYDSSQFESEQAISNNVFSVTQWTPDMGTPGAAEFAKRYQEKYGKKPTYHAACAYAAMMIAGEVAQKANGDRKKVQELLSTGTWNGLLGEVKFADYEGYTNQNQHKMPVIQYQGGKAVTVYPPELAKGKKAVFPFPGWGGTAGAK